MRRESFTYPPERAVLYMGSALRDLNAFPAEVRDEMFTAIQVARVGGLHPSAKPWKGLGSQVYEIAVNAAAAYRAVYTVQFKEVVYVLHAFQKKSKRGIKTPQREVELVRNRLKAAVADHGERYGRNKKAQ